MQTLTETGRMFYGIAMVAFGLLHIVYGNFVTRVVPWWPAWIPGRPIWAEIVGALLVAAGVALLLNRWTAIVSTLLACGLMVSFVLLGIPLMASDGWLGGSWTVAGKIIALCGGAILIAQSAAASSNSNSTSPLARVWWLGPAFLATFLIVCGIQHFLYIDFVITLFPAWIPGARFWSYFAGIALIAGGVGLLVPATTRLAGLLTGLMVFSWVFLIHLPLVYRAGRQPSNEITAVFEALAMSGIAWMAMRDVKAMGRVSALAAADTYSSATASTS